MENYKITAMGLPGKLDLGMIRYIPMLEPLCGFIDDLLIGKEFEGNCFICNFKSMDFTDIGELALVGLFNEDYIIEEFENLSNDARSALMSALKNVSVEFRRWRHTSTMDDSTNEDTLGGTEVVEIYANIWAMQKALSECEPNEVGSVLSHLILGYLYYHHGEALHNCFKGPIAYFENNHVNTIVDMSLRFTPSFLAPTYELTVTMGEFPNG